MFGLMNDEEHWLGRKLTAEERKKRKEEKEKAKKDRMEAALATAWPWDAEKQKWQELIVLKADTYKPHSLFDVKPWDLWGKRRMPHETSYFVESPNGAFRYVETLLPRGEYLSTWSTRGKGWVAWDGDVVIPTLYERRMNGGDQWNFDRTRPDPWMSLTPAELISLRPGTRFAKGHTVVAGLGLGWQLEQVLRRKQVTKVTLIERSKELVGWLMPKLRARVEKKEWAKLKVGIGDAYEVVPKLKADVALIDIFPGYGWNSFDKVCPNIGRVWVWGSSGPKESASSSYGSMLFGERGPW